MPPSFKESHAWVIYILMVKLKRPWKPTSTRGMELTFVSTNDGNNYHLLQPQSGTQDKKTNQFSSGKCKVKQSKFLLMLNSSSRDVKLKNSLMQQQIFIAKGRTTT